jgi:hypothetical protein
VRKKILVTVDTELTDGQIEAQGATLYLCEDTGGDHCHSALEVRVVRATEKSKAVEADVKYLRELADRIELGTP